jgi:hypothetical protein
MFLAGKKNFMKKIYIFCHAFFFNAYSSTERINPRFHRALRDIWLHTSRVYWEFLGIKGKLGDKSGFWGFWEFVGRGLIFWGVGGS